MLKNYEEAKATAMEVINRLYGGNKMGCCVTESKMTKRSRKTFWGFVFNSEDSNGEFIKQAGGIYTKFYKI